MADKCLGESVTITAAPTYVIVWLLAPAKLRGICAPDRRCWANTMIGLRMMLASAKMWDWEGT